VKKLVPTLSSKERAALAHALQGALPGMPAPAPASSSKAAPTTSGTCALAPETLRMLGIPPTAMFDLNSFAPLFGLLIEVLVLLDNAAWDVWDSFGTANKGLKREVVMKKAMSVMLTGKAKLTIPQLTLQIAILQRLTCELLAQMNQVGKYAREHFSKLSPQVIEKELDDGGWGGASARRCWEALKQRWPDAERETQDAVNKSIAAAVSAAINMRL
jgi:hypothetical protein